MSEREPQPGPAIPPPLPTSNSGPSHAHAGGEGAAGAEPAREAPAWPWAVPTGGAPAPAPSVPAGGAGPTGTGSDPHQSAGAGATGQGGTGGASASEPGAEQADGPGSGPGGDPDAGAAPEGPFGPADLRGLRFALFRFDEQPEPAPLTVRALPEGRRLGWEPAAAPAVYRVVTADGTRPYSPDDADELVVTAGTAALDDARPRAAVRYYQVWRYEGADLDAVRTAQPVLHAQGRWIVGVQTPHIAVDVQSVVARWQVLPGTVRVHVHRARPSEASHGLSDPRYRVSTQSPNLTGFADSAAHPGERYVYMVLAEVEADGASVLSEAYTATVDIPIRLQPVTDLSFTLHPGRVPTFDLRWSAPEFGRVEVFRTAQPPAAGLGEEPVPISVLSSQGGLTPEDLLSFPVSAGEDGTQLMAGVTWPHGWTRAYFTPVVFSGDEAFVGTTVHGVSVGMVEDARMNERVGRKLISFAWPEGADVVRLYRTRADGDAAAALQTSPLVEVDHSKYRSNGAIVLDDVVERDGARYFLVSGLFSGGAFVQSEPVELDCPPLMILGYEIAHAADQDGTWRGYVRVHSWGSTEHGGVPFVVVYNRERLPLHSNDGTPLPVYDQAGQPGGRFQPEFLPAKSEVASAPMWSFTMGSYGQSIGYIRVFADVAPEQLRRIALLDPAAVMLDLAGYSQLLAAQAAQAGPHQGGPGA
ncbi:hypothetical protein GSY69_09160 [Brevibacterium sp. 5221]|uniref:Uncharacterized protein n=1 Tax=Brevibacterium rongguiense TaxID=2695267 RepID=A0A6N9H7Y3_9MICO|nr:hypothetical protein [Brevibacterium rongguiense]MYM20130.1 hypothetical protein [Brevibacterium rongguiense]